MAVKIPVTVRAQLKRVPGLQPLIAFFREDPVRRKCREAEARRLPRMVAIELTNACNLTCAKCPRAAVKQLGFLDAALFTKILGDIRDSGEMTEIALSGSGEPTLHKQLVEFVRMARAVPNVGVIGFASNMVELTPDLSERLLGAGLTRLKVSLDADDPETYRRLYGGDAYDTVVGHLTSFCEINKKMGEPCAVTIKVTLYTDDCSIAERLKNTWAGKVQRVRATRLHNWAGLIGANRLRSRTTTCRPLWHQIQVCWDGQITLCCLDSIQRKFNMGNAADVNLVDYWQRDPELQKVRQLHKKCDFGTLPVCSACNEDEYFDVRLGG